MAAAIRDLREIFDKPEVRGLVESMVDTRLGFRTDQREGDNFKKPINYTWPEIRENVIEAMLTGYRITGNEFNIIGKNMYPTKEGKYRKIVEFPGLTGFSPTTTPAQYDQEERTGYKKQREMVQFAKVQCFATWKLGGTQHRIGYDDDRLVFKIKVNAGMGDDAIIGKALSKLYTRVLMRLTGSNVPESEDLDAPEAEIVPDMDMETKTPDEIRQPVETVNLADIAESVPDSLPETAYAFPFPPRVCGNTGCPAHTGENIQRCNDTDPMRKDPNGAHPFIVECDKFKQASPNSLIAGIPKGEIEKTKTALGMIGPVTKADDKWKIVLKMEGVI
jgi:hypothetical protein